MSDSNQDDNNRNPRFTRALLGRIIAVTLFVAAGTFAVAQMMMGGGKNGEEDGAGTQATEQVATTEPADQNTGSNSAKVASQKPGVNLATSTPAPPTRFNSGKGIATNSLGSGSQNNFQNSSRFNSTPTTDRNPSIIKTAKPSTQATKTTPPPRYAQLPNQGPPVIGNNSGFGTQPNSSTLGKLGQSISSTVQKTSDNAKKLGTDVKNSASGLLDNAKQTTINSVGNMRNNNMPAYGSSAKSQFNPTTQKKTTAPPALPTQRIAPSNPRTSPTLKAPVPSSSFGGSNTFNSASNTENPKSDFGGTKLRSSNQPSVSPITSPSRVPNKSKTTFGDAPLRQTSPIQNLQTRPASQPSSFPANPSSTRSPSTDKAPFNSSVNPRTEPSAAPTQSREQYRNPISATPASSSRLSNAPATNRPTSRLGNSGLSSALGGSAPSTARTRNTPGDRELEGVRAPALTVEKLAPREIQVQQPAEFQIVVRNVGRVPAEEVTVFDQIPAGTDFLNSSPEPTGVTADRKINWNIGSLRPGQEKRIKLQLRPTQPGEIGSVAHVTFATQASMRTLVTKPVLEITHRTNPKVMIGDDVIFDVIVTNKGDGAAKDVVIEEDVPKQLEYQDGYRELEYEIGTLRPGQSKRVQLGLKAAEIGRTRNVMFASAAGGLRAKHEIDLEVIAPNLVTSSRGPTRRFLQREVTHQFNVANKGTAKASNVDLVARMPAGLRFVRADNQGRYDANSHAVYWSLAELGLDVSAAVELVTVPVDIGNQDIKFEAMADLNQKSATQQKLSVEHLVDVFFDIDDVVDPIEIGTDTSYRIRVVNQGTKPATNVQLHIEFPSGLTPTSVEGNLQNQIQGQRIAFAPISSLNSGEQLQLVVHAKGQAAGDHRVVVNLQADGRQTPVSKEETTRVYADQ